MTRMVQVDLGIFDHKHKEIGISPNEGLQRMFSEVFSTVLRGLIEHQAHTVSNAQLSTLEVIYRRIGEESVKQFGVDSLVNKLPYDRHVEELAAQQFPSLLRPEIEKFLKCPVTQHLPSWPRVLACEVRLQEDLARAGLS